MVMEAAEVVVV
ncbi:unnamed protein product [Callosobruchus maculatus]|uniref:Uncharacterized protein n=1 Tax=Callosobruchus maculatus TaxID=64391 RepID=A0A653CRF5_CALMS|nr:unnamed protein product [Callosobruchus maculatus]